MLRPFVLTLKCIDRPGLVARIASLLYRCGGNITEAHQFNDQLTGFFFMRVAFDLESSAQAEATVRSQLSDEAAQLSMNWQLYDANRPSNVVILVSQHDHCLRDLLYKAWIHDLHMSVRAIVSNHPKGQNLSIADSIPFYHLPVTASTKPQQERQIRQIIDDNNADLVILARYMQILSNELSEYLTGRCINIHHSFLPGFKGARPYHQAYERGVKVIGATAHYVTSDLDDGPIIAQDVETVTHSHTPNDLMGTGRDIERRVLSRAVKQYLEHRVFVHGRRAIVFA